MPTEAARSTAAASLRDLAHSFAAHEPDDDVLAAITDAATALTGRVDDAPVRDRLKLMRRGVEESLMGLGFEDRAVGGGSNPTAVDLDVRHWGDGEGDDVVVDVVLRRALRGRTGPRARRDRRGGVRRRHRVRDRAAAGAGVHRRADGALPRAGARRPPARDAQPASTAASDASSSSAARPAVDGEVIATCRAIYITVDPSVFAQAPDPR